MRSEPRLQAGRLFFDESEWLRLPKPGTRCEVSGLSRTTLAELVCPGKKNGFQPPVAARFLKRRNASRGIVLISRRSLLEFINALPSPSSLSSLSKGGAK